MLVGILRANEIPAYPMSLRSTSYELAQLELYQLPNHEMSGYPNERRIKDQLRGTTFPTEGWINLIM